MHKPSYWLTCWVVLRARTAELAPSVRSLTVIWFVCAILYDALGYIHVLFHAAWRRICQSPLSGLGVATAITPPYLYFQTFGAAACACVRRVFLRSPTSSLAALGRRVSQLSSGVFETRNMIEEYEVRFSSLGFLHLTDPRQGALV